MASTLRPERVLVVAGPDGRLITSGGAASWEDLTLYLIERLCGRQEAVRTAKIFVFGDRGDGQLPYITMDRSSRHEDATIADCQQWIAYRYDAANPVARMVARSGLPERTFDAIGAAVGYDDPAFFRRLFKRHTGITPGRYRRRFGAAAGASKVLQAARGGMSRDRREGL